MEIDKLDDRVNEYNNTYHKATEMKPMSNTYINSSKEINDKDPKFQVGDHVRISTYKTIFAKGYTPMRSEEVSVIKRIKNTVPRTYVITDLHGEETIGTFYENELQKKTKKNLG